MRRREARLGGCDHCLEARMFAHFVERRVGLYPDQTLSRELSDDRLQQVERATGLAETCQRASKVVTEVDVLGRREQERAFNPVHGALVLAECGERRDAE